MAIRTACGTSGNGDLDTNTSNSQSVFKEHGTTENLFILTSELSGDYILIFSSWTGHLQ